MRKLFILLLALLSLGSINAQTSKIVKAVKAGSKASAAVKASTKVKPVPVRTLPSVKPPRVKPLATPGKLSPVKSLRAKPLPKLTVVSDSTSGKPLRLNKEQIHILKVDSVATDSTRLYTLPADSPYIKAQMKANRQQAIADSIAASYSTLEKRSNNRPAKNGK